MWNTKMHMRSDHLLYPLSANARNVTKFTFMQMDLLSKGCPGDQDGCGGLGKSNHQTNDYLRSELGRYNQ